MKKRIISFFMATIIAFTVIFVPLLLSINVSALTPTYNMSTSYKNSKYYKNLAGLQLTGDQRTDIVRVALTQLGYHEGNSNSDFHGGNSSGSKNFVEYNRLHGRIDNNEGNGLSYGYYWCASFATWCANQAGISISDIRKSVSCRELVSFFQSKGTYKTRASGYVPKTGDIILFKDAGSSVSSTHTGIVIYSSGGKVYTIEGNASSLNAVALREYDLTSTYIVGYGSPALKENAAEKIDFSMSSGYLRGDYVVAAASVAVKKNASSSASTLASLARGDVIKVMEISGAYGKVTVGSVTGWIKLSDLRIITVQKYTVKYDANGADTPITLSMTQKYNSPFKITNVIPTKEGYVFLGWAESKSASDAQYVAGETISPHKDTTLYAVWERNTCVIKFYNYDGTLISSATYKLGDTVKTPSSNPVRHSDGVNNYVFVGWDSPIVKASADATYTAVFKTVPIPTLPSVDNDADSGNSSGGALDEGVQNTPGDTSQGGAEDTSQGGEVDIDAPTTDADDPADKSEGNLPETIETKDIIIMVCVVGVLIVGCLALVILRKKTLI